VDALTITSRLVIPGAALSFTAVRASGPGGQNVNKVSSKVELRFDVRASALLSEAEKMRLAAICGNSIDNDGVLRVVSQATRDQSRNIDDARAKLADLIRQALVVPKKRRKTKPSRSAQKRRLDSKRHESEKKQSRARRGDD
jgi:ribosome-associated protein